MKTKYDLGDVISFMEQGKKQPCYGKVSEIRIGVGYVKYLTEDLKQVPEHAVKEAFDAKGVPKPTDLTLVRDEVRTK